jgi:hypothetical protein
MIAPGTIDEDGRVRTVKHVQELLKDVPDKKGEKDEDEDEN